MKRALATAAALAACIPPLIALWYIHTYGVNGAHWDHLTNAELFDRYYTGSLGAAYLLKPHLEHIKLFPRLVWLVLGLPSHFNNLVEMYAQWAIMCAAAAVLYSAVRRRTSLSHAALLTRFVPICLLLFTVRQHEAMLVGDGMIAYLTVAAGLVALALIDRGGVPRATLAAAAVFVAAFSHASGFLLWPIGLAMLLMDPGFARKPVAAAIWIAVTAGAVALYAAHWPETAGASLSFAAARVGKTIEYAISAAGTPFGQAPSLQARFGACAMVLQGIALALAVRERWRGGRVPFGAWLILFAWGVQALVAWGRLLGDAGLGVASRYAVFIGLGMAGAYLTALELARDRHRLGPRLLGAAALVVILAGSVTGYREGLNSGPIERDGRLRAVQVLRTVPQQTDEALATLLYPFAPHARLFAASLEQRRLNVFARPLRGPDELPRGDGPPLFFLDQVNFAPISADTPVTFGANRTIALSGWAFERRTRRPFASGFLRMSPSGLLLPLAYGLERGDVVSALHLRRGAAPGFAATFSSDALAPGENALRLEFIAADDRVFVTPTVARLVRRP